MVKKGDPGAPAPEPVLPDLPDAVPAEHLTVPAGLDFSNFDFAAAGSPHRWADYEAGERIDHGDAMTIEEAGHQMATVRKRVVWGKRVKVGVGLGGSRTYKKKQSIKINQNKK